MGKDKTTQVKFFVDKLFVGVDCSPCGTYPESNRICVPTPHEYGSYYHSSSFWHYANAARNLHEYVTDKLDTASQRLETAEKNLREWQYQKRLMEETLEDARKIPNPDAIENQGTVFLLTDNAREVAQNLLPINETDDFTPLRYRNDNAIALQAFVEGLMKNEHGLLVIQQNRKNNVLK